MLCILNKFVSIFARKKVGNIGSIAGKNNWLPALDKNAAYILPHTNTLILLELYCGTITEPGLPVLDILMET